MTAVLIALGDEFHRDDGVGPVLAGGLLRSGIPARVRISHGDPLELIEWWRGAPVAVMLDAVVALHPRPGRVHLLETDDLPVTRSGTHGFDLGAAIALGRALGHMPDRMVIVGVEVTDVGPGRGLSPAVAAAEPAVARAVALALAGGSSGPDDHE